VLLKRIRYVDKKPIAIESAYINPSIDLRLLNVLQKDMEKESLYRFIQKELSINLSWAEEIFEVTRLSRKEAVWLRVNAGECAILRKRFTYTEERNALNTRFHCISVMNTNLELLGSDIQKCSLLELILAEIG